MKYTASLLVTAVLVLGISAASAQNQPTTNVAPPPNSINKGSTTKPSGAEAQPAAHNSAPRVTGRAKFCSETAGGRLLRCRYRSMKTCEKSKAHGNLRCVARPS
jgi:hypothetical protein